MTPLEQYLAAVRQLIQQLPGARAERYDEQLLTAERGNVRIRLRFADQALLEISEALVFVAGEPHWLSYRYHYQEPATGFWFRYDNAPHQPEVRTHPDHKHMEGQILASAHPSIERVLHEVMAFRNRSSEQH